jgi:hypothetical protein
MNILTSPEKSRGIEGSGIRHCENFCAQKLKQSLFSKMHENICPPDEGRI